MNRALARQASPQPLGRVLVVDDSALARAVVCRRLHAAGYEVLEAVDGASALSMLNAASSFDVVVTDLRMPSVDGFGLLEAVHKQGLQTEVIVLTGSYAEDQAAAIPAFRSGASDFLATTLEQALSAVEQAVERRRRREELRETEERLRDSEAALRLETEQLEAVAEAMMSFLTAGEIDEPAARLLQSAMQQTGSPYGCIGVVDGESTFRVVAERGAVRGDSSACQPALADADNLFLRVVGAGSALLVNDPPAGSRPPGCASVEQPLRSFLGVPIVRRSEVVGMIGVANRPEGYTTVEKTRLEVLCRATGVIFDSCVRRQREAVLERQLRQSQKMEAVGRLAGGIVHDFNNVLAAIMGYAELLRRGLGPTHAQAGRVDGILRSAERAASLTRQLLAFSRRQISEPRILDLNLIVAGVGDMLQRLIGEDIELLTLLEHSLGSVRADRSQIEQVLFNLAANARDSMTDGGRLIIETSNVVLDKPFVAEHLGSRPGAYVMLSVVDNGDGMDRETQSHIFEPFFTTKAQGKGTGLGLATVFGIVKQAGGYITVESAPQQGASFRIYLPRVDGAPEEPAPTPERVMVRGSARILLVEDEETLRKLLAEVLESSGHSVMCARTAEEALRIGRECEEPIQLLLTDLVLPGLNGHQLAKRLAESRPQMKTLYMSGYTESALLREIAAGIEPVLFKPFAADVLLRQVAATLEAPA